MFPVEPPETPAPPGGTAERPRHDPVAALRFRDFRLLIMGSFLAVFAEQMLMVAVGWELYERTRDPLALGLVGLVEIVPVLLLALPAGQVADRRERKWVVVAAMSGLAACAFGLVVLSLNTGPLPAIYALLFGIGVARSFQSPAFSAMSAQVVPSTHYGSAAAWSSGAWQTAAIVGPALGGLLIALWGGAAGVYATSGGLLVLVALLFCLLRPRPVDRVTEPINLTSLLAGVRFIWRTPLILTAITLDMFAVLLGGATALLPVFARDILEVGAGGLGWLRAAPAAGALVAALTMALMPPLRYAGRTLLVVVAGFGVATVVFGLSRDFALSLSMLALLGALDSVSVVIRSTLVLTLTPDALRGRVNAVHYVFVGISNELGAFESGVAAALIGTVGAVVAGGLGTLLVVVAVAVMAPELRRLGRLDTHHTS
ncbi:MAG TPA: MFS transporter [Chloroflexia bacterium]|nr:MFS transporter [Chloroflexia bacterium]